MVKRAASRFALMSLTHVQAIARRGGRAEREKWGLAVLLPVRVCACARVRVCVCLEQKGSKSSNLGSTKLTRVRNQSRQSRRFENLCICICH